MGGWGIQPQVERFRQGCIRYIACIYQSPGTCIGIKWSFEGFMWDSNCSFASPPLFLRWSSVRLRVRRLARRRTFHNISHRGRHSSQKHKFVFLSSRTPHCTIHDVSTHTPPLVWPKRTPHQRLLLPFRRGRDNWYRVSWYPDSPSHVVYWGCVGEEDEVFEE
jgi:hypothetical protein